MELTVTIKMLIKTFSTPIAFFEALLPLKNAKAQPKLNARMVASCPINAYIVAPQCALNVLDRRLGVSDVLDRRRSDVWRRPVPGVGRSRLFTKKCIGWFAVLDHPTSSFSCMARTRLCVCACASALRMFGISLFSLQYR